MNRHALLPDILALTLGAALALLLVNTVMAQDQVAPAAEGGGAKTIYRLVMPDGSITYSDKPQKGAKVERTVNIEPTLQTGGGDRPAVPPAVIERSPVQPSAAPGGPRLSPRDEAENAVVKAQLALEEARRRQSQGVEPQPGERTGNVGGGSRLNEAYRLRQSNLARDVAEAEQELQRSRAEYDRLR